MRVYLPLTLPGLAALHRTGERGPAPLAAVAVTPALRAWYGGDADEEELEYAALGEAADASLRLLAADPAAPRRRVVLAAEVPDRAVVPGTDPGAPGAVTLTAPVPLARLAAVHLDAATAEPDIAAALAGGTDADDPGHELLWYGVQEIPHLLP
ncbi:DUF6912 family protein [Streptomyces sp. AA0539]|uniref:DUF6912 family protein n=1 Tax=Streptomyces sp. AA0539 TaxID=1210045 RepID=UPI0002F4879C|nr:hypothetical protein [Streptomyces sp. AA0539]